MKTKEESNPSTVAFNKTYFVNLFTGDIKCNDFTAARVHYPNLAKIAEKLTNRELEILINKIEELL